jgi:hypothetical protein
MDALDAQNASQERNHGQRGREPPELASVKSSWHRRDLCRKSVAISHIGTFLIAAVSAAVALGEALNPPPSFVLPGADRQHCHPIRRPSCIVPQCACFTCRLGQRPPVGEAGSKKSAVRKP